MEKNFENKQAYTAGRTVAMLDSTSVYHKAKNPYHNMKEEYFSWAEGYSTFMKEFNKTKVNK